MTFKRYLNINSVSLIILANKVSLLRKRIKELLTQMSLDSFCINVVSLNLTSCRLRVTFEEADIQHVFIMAWNFENK